LWSTHLISFLCSYCREKAIDAEANALEVYKRHVPLVLSTFKDEIPLGLTESLMLANTVDWEKKRPITYLTGKQIWNSIWQPLQRYIGNVMLKFWMEVRPVTKNGVVRSGVENWEPVLLELRIKLFNFEKNSNCLLEENIDTDKQSEAEDDGEKDQVIQSNQSKKSAKKSKKSSPNNTPKTSATSTPTPSAEGALETSGISTIAANNDLDNTGDVQKESESSKRGPKSREPGKMIPFDPNWFPLAWVAFREFGPLGENPYEKWISQVTPKDTPIDVDADGNLVIIPDSVQKETNDQSLGRQAQRKKARDEMRRHPKNKKTVSLDSDGEEDVSQLNSILSEFSTIRKNLTQSDSIQDYEATTRRSQLKMDLIAKMNMTEEEKQIEYQKIWDSLEKKPESS
jgi:hypothetical protein